MSCAAFNEMFQEAEQKVSDDLIKKKFKISNAYWGRITDGGPWPLHSGVRIRKDRLTAYGFGNHDQGWETVEDSLCQTDLCADPTADRIQHAGWEELYYGLEQYNLLTDWICLQTMLFRRIPEEQLAHLESHLQDATRYYWEEFYRSRYIDNCENKMVAFVRPELLTQDCCATGKDCKPQIKMDGFVWERRPNIGTVDERYIRVNCRVEDLPRISDLTLDMLDLIKIDLSDEDANFPYLDQGFPLLDVVVGDERQNIRIAEQENALMDRAISWGGYDPSQLQRKIGTFRVWRDSYSFRMDRSAPRFYPDVDFNNALTAPYDPQNPSTWPRLKRVFKTVPVKVKDGEGFGIKHVKNQAYRDAPFVINTVFTPQVIKSRSFPETRSVGSAKLADTPTSYGGSARWRNPDWPCNVKREKGFWSLHFAAAIEPNYTEYGYAILTRIDHSIVLSAVDCELGAAPCVSRLTAYCHEGLAGDEAALNGSAGANRSVQRNIFDYLW